MRKNSCSDQQCSDVPTCSTAGTTPKWATGFFLLPSFKATIRKISIVYGSSGVRKETERQVIVCIYNRRGTTLMIRITTIRWYTCAQTSCLH
jgi:hypothetical protein